MPIPPLLFVLVAACSEDPLRNAPINPNNNNPPDAGVPNNPAPDTGVPATEPDSGVPNPEPDAGEMPMPNGVETMEAGTATLGPSGDSELFTFELPEGVVSFSILLRGQEDGTFIIRKLDGPLGNFVTDDPSNVNAIEMFLLGPFAPQFKSPNRVVQDRGLAASAFPNNPGVMVSGGMYSMVITGVRISGNQATPIQGPVDVIIQYRKQRVTSGKLDLSLYFSGAGMLTASTGPTTPLIMEAIEHLKMIYAQANIEIGMVNYYDIDPSYQTIEGVDGSDDQLEQMFKLSDGHGAGLHFFLVERFEAGALPGANIAGISGGLPGPALTPGSVNSGVAVALSTVMGDAGTLAHVMAHEGGHWLGLFHTTEITQTDDQMPDTPSGQQGNIFLMYPTVGGSTMISANQAAVLRQHPEVVAVTVE